MSAWQIIKTYDSRFYVMRSHRGVREYLQPDGKINKQAPFFYDEFWEATRTINKFLPALGKQIEDEYFERP